ncbi:MAG: carboxypeptidase regulatory-like domain-containing protein [Clostridia bacterium]|nr:carboxypeptidase regulatory-like domain-containing protein [Clostridia bacterium]
MKRFLTLFVVLCLILTAMALASCGGGNDTDTNTDTNTDTSTDTSTDTDTKTEVTYVITVKDQDGEVIANAKISILDSDDNQVRELTTDANGQATVKLAGTYFLDITELPEGYLDVVGTVKLENADTVVKVENNIPNGTASRPYPVNDANEIKLGANETVYYVSYGGGRNLLVENAQGLKLTYGDDEPREANEDGKIEFKMPVVDDLYNRAVVIKLENTTDEEKTYNLTIYSDKGALDNPYDIVLDENTKITVEKEKTVYYKHVAEKDGMIVVYSETANNNIYCYNMTTYATSAYTNGSVCEYIYANKGDEVMVYVSSNADKNYNPVEFKVSHYAGTEAEPIPLYKEETSFILQPSQTLYFKEATKIAGLASVEISGASYVATFNGEELTPSEDGIVDISDVSKDAVFAVVSTNENDREDIFISVYAPDLPQS